MPNDRQGSADRLLVTCEHGGNRVPPRYRSLFAGSQRRLESHEGFDLGALELARRFARHFQAPLHAATVTRLLVELNRSPHHPRLFSSVTRSLDRSVRGDILRTYYTPYRDAVRQQVTDQARAGQRTIHLSIHSFTPIWRGEVRRADIGLLYDPSRPGELRLCRAWQLEMRRLRPELSVRRNYPYLGRADGLATSLRKLFSAEEYVGIEVEVNQRWPQKNRPIWQTLQMSMIVGFEAAWSSR